MDFSNVMTTHIFRLFNIYDIFYYAKITANIVKMDNLHTTFDLKVKRFSDAMSKTVIDNNTNYLVYCVDENSSLNNSKFWISC